MDSRHPYLSPNKNTRAVRVVDGHQATNTKLLTNPIPVNNSGLLLPSTRIRLSVSRDYLQNVALYPNPIPLNDSWNLLGPNARVRVSTSDASSASDILLYPPIGSTVNWGRQFDVPLVGGAASLNNLALTNVVAATAPFYTQDFAKAFFPPAAKTGAQYYSLNIATLPPPDLTTNRRAPVVAKPFALLPNRGDPVGINLALLTAVAPVQLPFNQYIWTPTLTAPSAPSITFNTTYTLPAPFVPYDTSYARINPDWLPSPQYPNLALLNTGQVVASPFYTQDFSKPFFPRPAKLDQQQYNSSFYPNTIPFAKYDWAVQNFQNPRAPDASVSINPNLFTNPAPFAQYDWSKTQFLTPRAPDASVAPNLNFYTNPIPFAQYEWAKISFQTPRAPDASQLTNPNLYPPVFVPPPVDGGSTVLSDRKAGGGYYPRKKWEALLEEIRLEKAALATPTKSKSARDAVARAKRAAAEAAEQLERNQAEELARNVVSAERASKAVEAIRLANEIVENANALIYDEDEAEEKLIRLLLGTL